MSFWFLVVPSTRIADKVIPTGEIYKFMVQNAKVIGCEVKHFVVAFVLTGIFMSVDKKR